MESISKQMRAYLRNNPLKSGRTLETLVFTVVMMQCRTARFVVRMLFEPRFPPMWARRCNFIVAAFAICDGEGMTLLFVFFFFSRVYEYSQQNHLCIAHKMQSVLEVLLYNIGIYTYI